MARIGSAFLDYGDTFPTTTFPLTDGGVLTVPDASRAGWTALLFYRGHW